MWRMCVCVDGLGGDIVTTSTNCGANLTRKKRVEKELERLSMMFEALEERQKRLTADVSEALALVTKACSGGETLLESASPEGTPAAAPTSPSSSRLAKRCATPQEQPFFATMRGVPTQLSAPVGTPTRPMQEKRKELESMAATAPSPETTTANNPLAAPLPSHPFTLTPQPSSPQPVMTATAPCVNDLPHLAAFNPSNNNGSGSCPLPNIPDVDVQPRRHSPRDTTALTQHENRHVLNAAASCSFGEAKKHPLCGSEAAQGQGCLPRFKATSERGPSSLPEESLLVSSTDAVLVVLSLAACILSVAVCHPNLELATREPATDVVAVFLTIEVLSLGWIATRFFVRTRRKTWEITDDPSGIRKAYLQSWFAFDLMYSLPLEVLFIGWLPAAYHYCSLRHFLRCVRILSLGRSSNPLLQSRQWFRFFSFCCGVFLVCHITASIFWALEGRTYIDALWWAVATMTTVGYGDVVPTTEASRMYGMFTMITGVMMVSSLTAFATSFLTSKDPLMEEQEEKKRMMHSMANYYRVPWTLQKEIISLFPSVLEKHNQREFESIANSLPSFIKSQLDLHVNAKLLREIPFFASVADDDLMLSVSAHLQQRFHPPFETIVRFGEDAVEMFFIVRGVVEVLVPLAGEWYSLTQLRHGTWFGELALLDKAAKRRASVVSLTAVELLCLSKADFNSLSAKFPTFDAMVRAEAAKRQSDLADSASPLLLQTLRKSASPTARTERSEIITIIQQPTTVVAES